MRAAGGFLPTPALARLERVGDASAAGHREARALAILALRLRAAVRAARAGAAGDREPHASATETADSVWRAMTACA